MLFHLLKPLVLFLSSAVFPFLLLLGGIVELGSSD